MRFDIMTLFPEMIGAVLGESIIGRAQSSGAIAIGTHNIRDYTLDKHKKVDDTPYGGGFGMLMAAQPICDCYDAICEKYPSENRHTVYMSPRGDVLTHETAKRLSGYDHLVILCGHYEGVDQRALDEIVDEEISIGDYVLTGGELPACILVDVVSRMVPGVLPDDECYEKESIASGLLEYPQYTKPPVYRGRAVPDVLLSGHHEKIEQWRQEEAERLTKERRPELYESYLAAHPKPQPKPKKNRRKTGEPKGGENV